MSAPAATGMWEVRAAPGRAGDLVAWVRDVALPALREAGGLERAEVFRGEDDRVVVISVWAADSGAADSGAAGSGAAVPAAMPEPPAALVARPPHAWRFERVLP